MRCVQAVRTCGHTVFRWHALSNPLLQRESWRACSSEVTMSQGRLEEFMRAEIGFFSQKQPREVKLQNIVSVTTPIDVAKLVHEELPLRFAHRLKHMESVPRWQECAELATLYDVFYHSFKDLRLVEPTPSSLSAFTEVIFKVRQRHKVVIPVLGQAIQSLYHGGFLPEVKLNAWVDEFMLSRICTEMLTAHFKACLDNDRARSEESTAVAESWWGPTPEPENPSTGIVDMECDPALICRQAAESVQRSFRTPWFPDVTVCIEVKQASTEEDIGFCYISKYLFFIVEELLTNSARAVVQNSSTPDQLHGNKIKVTVCADPKNVAISICDRGGGIKDLDRVWSYAYSSSDGSEEHVKGTSPLGGCGMGLPLSRLYVRYLGGSLDVMNMPGIGVDTYLFLNRVNLDL